jgi:hypothetical protein
MPASLPRDALTLSRAFLAAELAAVRLRLRLGQMAIRLMNAGSYGSEGVPALARACGLAEGTVYRFAQVAATWSVGEFEDLIVGRTAPALTWSHLLELSRVRSRVQRARLTKEARQRGWSTREVKRRVNQLVGGAA